MEKVQLIELMDSAIELDKQLSDWMKGEEASLAEEAEALDQKLPESARIRWDEFEAHFQETATNARALMIEEAAQIEAMKQTKLRQVEEAFQNTRAQMVNTVMQKIRGDRLD